MWSLVKRGGLREVASIRNLLRLEGWFGGVVRGWGVSLRGKMRVSLGISE